MPIGTLMRKAKRQLAYSMSSAPIVGAAVVMVPVIVDHTPMAHERRSGGMVLMMMASTEGVSIAPPTACTTRAPMSTGTVGATAQIALPVVNSASDVRNTRLRPTRSAIRPAGMSSAAATIANDVSTHDTNEIGTSGKSARMLGYATNINDRSSALTAEEIETSASTRVSLLASSVTGACRLRSRPPCP
jgi:hypothetical protein